MASPDSHAAIGKEEEPKTVYDVVHHSCTTSSVYGLDKQKVRGRRGGHHAGGAACEKKKEAADPSAGSRIRWASESWAPPCSASRATRSIVKCQYQVC